MTKRRFIIRIKRRFFRLKKSLKRFFLKEDLALSLDWSNEAIGRLFLCLRKKRIILVIFLPIFIYYLLSFLLISSESVCLESLRLSFVADGACREECLLNRLQDRDCIISKFKEGSSLEKKVFTYLKNENLDFSFRLEMLGILKDFYETRGAPIYLVSYLESASGDQKMKAEIFSAFDWELVGGSPLSYYFAILESEVSLELRLAAALKISSYNKKSSAFSLNDLDVIKSIIFRPNTDSYLRQSLVLLLSDYQSFFPEETDLIFYEILNANFYQDNISRAFAADFINQDLPEISDSEWNNYYQR